MHPSVDWSGLDAIIRKGNDAGVDSCSGFRENRGPDGNRPGRGLAGWLREREVEEVFVCGLARDVCVLWPAQDAIQLGFRTRVVWDLTRPVSPDTDNATRQTLADHGVGCIDSSRLPSA